MEANRLYFGDCLDVMREDIPNASVDLIYLDPPFNSKRLYNAFMGGAQWVAFDDTWRWYEAVDDFHAVAGRTDMAGVMEGLRLMLGEGPELAYLSYMANRLLECRRVLKNTGSIYLHCDPTMSHYLKAIMDGVFGKRNFRNEITWQRFNFHADAKRYGRVSDILLFYSMSDSYVFNQLRVPYSAHYIASKFTHKDTDGRRFRLSDLNPPGGRGPVYEFHGVKKAWRFSEDNMLELEKQGRIYSDSPIAQLKRYLDETDGQAVHSVWTDIPVINSRSKERLNYPTQKPLALLHRIIQASSREGDVVLDPFCGCGTAIHAAQNLNRQWIGIDICVNACKVIEQRLRSHFDSIWSDVEFIGIPRVLDHAKTLADLDKFRFERWAASLVDGMEANKKQHGDGGIDGWGRLAVKKGQFIDIVSQVKGGSTGPGDVQAFNGARQQAKADLGIFTCFDDRVTNGMRDAAASAGRFMETPIIQLYTIEDYFEGRRPVMPVAI